MRQHYTSDGWSTQIGGAEQPKHLGTGTMSKLCFSFSSFWQGQKNKWIDFESYWVKLFKTNWVTARWITSFDQNSCLVTTGVLAALSAGASGHFFRKCIQIGKNDHRFVSFSMLPPPPPPPPPIICSYETQTLYAILNVAPHRPTNND